MNHFHVGPISSRVFIEECRQARRAYKLKIVCPRDSDVPGVPDYVDDFAIPRNGTPADVMQLLMRLVTSKHRSSILPFLCDIFVIMIQKSNDGALDQLCGQSSYPCTPAFGIPRDDDVGLHGSLSRAAVSSACYTQDARATTTALRARRLSVRDLPCARCGRFGRRESR